ncbi:MAG: dynamin family protein [Ilumatobacteraceae bacterium]
MTDTPPERSSTDPAAAATTVLADLAEATRRAASAYGRPDLADRLDRVARRSTDRPVRVLVVGEFKQGKSTLVNSLLNADVCGVADDVSTVVPTTVRFGDEPTATLHFVTDEDVPRTETIELSTVREWATEQGNPGNRAGLASVEVTIPRKLLQSGIAIVDTPGVGGLDSAHGAAAAAALTDAEMVLFVSDCSQALTASELGFLKIAHEHCRNLVLVQPKTDIQANWRSVVATNRELFEREGIDARILPISSALRGVGVRENSTELNEEAGFPEVIRAVRDAASGDTVRTRIVADLAEVLFVVGQLRSTFETELAMLDDPDGAEEVRTRMQSAQARAEHLRSQSAKWQQTLNDGMQDVTSDMDHDLRTRFRRIIAEAEQTIDDSDPSDMWDEFSQWLDHRLAWELSVHHREIVNRANEVAVSVAEHFADEENDLQIAVDAAVPRLAPTPGSGFAEFSVQHGDRTGNALAAVRGSYGGVLMFSMIGQLVGMAAMNPLSLVLGLGLGRKGMRDEKRRQLLQRQQQAKLTMRKYVDDVNLEQSKGSRDQLRRVQRSLRDEFSARADQLQTTIRESLKSAEHSTKQALGERQRRSTDIRAELQRLDVLTTHAEKVRTTLGVRS